MRLSRAMLAVVAVAVLPLVALAICAAGAIALRAKDTFLCTTVARSHATLAAGDGMLMDTANVLQAIAGRLRSTPAGVKSFEQEAELTLSAQPNWRTIVLHDASGQLLANARPQWAAGPGRGIEAILFSRDAASTGRPQFSTAVVAGPQGSETAIIVSVPVPRFAADTYVMTAAISAKSYYALLEQQRLPSGWSAGVVNPSGQYVARYPQVQAGMRAPQQVIQNISSRTEGTFESYLSERQDSAPFHTAFARSPLTGWTVVFTVPDSEVVNREMEVITVWGLGLWLALGFTAGVLFFGVRWISLPVREFTQQVKTMCETGKAEPVETPIDELRTMSLELATAANAMETKALAVQSQLEEVRATASRRISENESKKRFLALLSMELRAPLAPLEYGILMLTREGTPDDKVRQLSLMERQLKRLRQLITELVDVGRVDRDALDIHPTVCNLLDVIRAGVDATRAAMESKGQMLTISLPEQNAWARADPMRITDVVAHLLDNARRFSPAGAHIELTAAASDSMLVIKVKDPGIGFFERDGEQMFEMFSRLQARAVTHAMGISLALSRWIVQAHDGELSGTSPGPGKGACFRLALPLMNIQ